MYQVWCTNKKYSWKTFDLPMTKGNQEDVDERSSAKPVSAGKPNFFFSRSSAIAVDAVRSSPFLGLLWKMCEQKKKQNQNYQVIPYLITQYGFPKATTSALGEQTTVTVKEWNINKMF